MNKKNKKNNGTKEISTFWVLLLAVAILAVVVQLVVGIYERTNNDDERPPAQVGDLQKVSIDLGNSLELIEAGKYSGVYMEDGTDEIVSGVMMIVVKNNGTKAIQYAEIEVPVDKEIARFSLSTLPAGESILLLEKSRMDYRNERITMATAKNVAFFQTPMSLFEELLKVQTLDGLLNVSNISGEAITGDVVIYYKNASSDMLYGGITYRVTIKGGFGPSEIKQVAASHFMANGSRIMFVTVG